MRSDPVRALRQPVKPSPVWTPADGPLQEGRDYAFLAKVAGRPIHWAITNPITVGFIHRVPADVSATLNLAIGHLGAHCRLPLVRASGYTTPDIALQLAQTLPSSGSDQICLGAAQPQWNTGSGLIVSATVIVVEGLPPDTLRGTVAHELAHALGVGHCTSTAELMAPLAATNRWLGLGDMKALRLVGRWASAHPAVTAHKKRVCP